MNDKRLPADRVPSQHARRKSLKARADSHASRRSVRLSHGQIARHGERAMGDRDDRRRVFIQLSEDQVDGLIAHASEVEGPGVPVLGQQSAAGHSTQWVFRPLMQDKSYSRSLLIGLEVLTCFPLDGTERGVAEVAQQLNMTNSTVHRYIITLLRVGLLERNPDTRWYRVTSPHLSGTVE